MSTNNPIEYLIPGWGYFNDPGDGKQWLLPRAGISNDNPVTVGPSNAGNFFLLFGD